MLPINKKISSYNHYDYNNPKFIVLHYVGAQSSTAKNNADYFFGGDRQASAHYFVDDNSIWQSVEDLNGAWAVGNTKTEVNNQNSLNIEMCCFAPNLGVTENTENNTLELVHYLMQKYKIPLNNLKTHYEVSGSIKICPNWNVNNWSRYNNFKEKLNKLLNKESFTSVGKGNDVIYRVKLANGEQIGAFRSLENAKNLAKINKCNVYSSLDNKVLFSYIDNPAVVIKPINYRVKRKNGEQLGAFNSLDNAVNLAEKEKAIVYDSKGNIIKSYIPENNLGYLNLKSHMNSWRVYRVDGPYTLNYSIGALAPANYGGLSYKIYEKKATDVYKIKTEMFGYVSIYAPKDNDSSITENPIY